MKRKSGVGLALMMMATALADPASAEGVNHGQVYYEKICAKCHETGIGPMLRDRGLSAMTIVAIARNGKGAMPAFRITDIDDETLDQLANYLASNPVPQK